MKKATSSLKPGNEYDRVFKENMQLALPGIIKRLLGLRLVHSEDLPAELQQTKERKPDVLKKATDTNGQTFILHIEWQLKNDREMLYRMAEYRIMLMRKYHLLVKQYVIFIGTGKSTMQQSIEEQGFSFHYQIIALSQVNYKLFLQSKEPGEKLLAILANFGTEKEEKVIAAIIRQVRRAVGSDLTAGKYFNQLRVLAQLRNLPFKIEDMLDSISTFFKEEKDPFYIRGQKKGIELGREEGIEEGIEKGIEKGEAKKGFIVVANLIEKLGLNDEQAADIAKVTVEFVKEVRSSLKNSDLLLELENMLDSISTFFKEEETRFTSGGTNGVLK